MPKKSMGTPTPNPPTKTEILFDYLLKIAAAASIPLLVFAVSLYNTSNLEVARNNAQETKIEQIALDQKETGKEITNIKIYMGKSQVYMENVDDSLSEIRAIISKNPSPSRNFGP